MEYLQTHVLSTSSHLVWLIDGADRIFRCPHPNDVFSMLRTWHGKKEWARLTLVLSYTTETQRLIDPESQSPFNVGIMCRLERFTIEQVQELNKRYDLPINSTDELRQFYDYTGGLPALTQQGLYYLAQNGPGI